MRSLRIPAGPNQPLEGLEIDGPDSLAHALRGTPQAITDPAAPGLRGYRNAEVDVLAGITVNLRATRLFGGVRPDCEFLAGDIIVLGTEPGHEDDQPCPASVEERLRAPAAIGAPQHLRAENRRQRMQWVTSDDGAGARTLAILSIGYHPATGPKRGGDQIVANHFAAVLSFAYQLPAPAPVSKTIHGELHGDGLSVVRETVPRYTRSGLAHFTGLAVDRVRGLAAGGDERVARYFT
jgi:hypothetical protein